MTRVLFALVVVALGVALGCGGAPDAHRHGAAAPAAAQAPKQLWTCGMHPQVIRDRPGNCPICGMALTPLETRPGEAAHAIVIDPVLTQNMGLRTAPVVEGPLDLSVRASGQLGEAEPARHDVNLRVSGWIQKLHAHTEGMHVHRGDPLFELYSPDVRVAVDELIAARRAGAAGVARAAEARLRLWGLDGATVEKLGRMERAPETVVFTSPVTGHVVVKDVVEGAAVKAGDRVLRIVDHSSLWLDAQVFEQDLPLIRIGQHATAVVAGFPDAPVTGAILFIHPHLDMETRTARVRIAVENPSLILRPGMWGTVEIAVPAVERATLVPREAVIETGLRRVAFVQREPGHFEPRDVTVGRAGRDGTVEVLAGLAAGDTVVVSGQFLLDAESRMREAIRKHLDTAGAQPQ
jgi:multidrug efflux pump subunit AcrA (membrane-fusion protein)